MRAELNDASLARYAGRFVWLELNFDKPSNQDFITKHGVEYTPSLYVLDPTDERATATQLGGLTLAELTRFLERGERGVLAKSNSPVGAALAQGDELLGRGQRSAAIASYREAIRLGGDGWPEHGRAVASYAWVLMNDRQYRACADTAAAEAPTMKRSQVFARVVLAGISCLNQETSAPWAVTARKTLQPLAIEAAAVPGLLRDHRFQLYQQLMYDAGLHNDNATLKKWGERWLAEIAAIKPTNDDERSALDVSRVDAASTLEEPLRVIPDLIASEKAMPANYNASLRLAQMETAAKRYNEAIAACDRGLAHVTGPMGRVWLLETKADALMGKKQPSEAQDVLQQALRSAREIGLKTARDRNISKVETQIKEAEDAAHHL
ncbi:MAG TPA: hypothetical protein VKU01_00585 [Bryobacteraceae bacterium]|nr:hypothetical protein [Bryobacteraceae bacterium]